MKSSFNSTSNPYSNTSDVDTSGSTTLATKPSSRIFQPIQLKGVELLSFPLCLCIGFVYFRIVLLCLLGYSINQSCIVTSPKEYKSWKSSNRLQLELDSILAPSTVRGNIQDFIPVIFKLSNYREYLSTESEDSVHVH